MNISEAKNSPRYIVNEVFYSLQGEGARVGTANVFVRFAHCNLQCRVEAGPHSPGGFDCDTEFASGREMYLEQLIYLIQELGGKCRNVIFTGGEPSLQLNKTPDILPALIQLGYKNIIETNGSQPLMGIMQWLNYITCSPKVAEHAIRLEACDEIRYVRGYQQAIPQPRIKRIIHQIISPAFEGSDLDEKTLKWCIGLCKDNPDWRLSVQQHKQAWKVR